MADERTTDESVRGKVIEDARGHARVRLSQALDTIQDGADSLRALASTLDEKAVGFTDGAQVRSTAVTVRAVATQVQITALTLAESGERLSSWQAIEDLLDVDVAAFRVDPSE